MANHERIHTRLIDCDMGRQMGCQSYCCRLIVRLKPHEVVSTNDGTPAKNCVDKDASGYCIHFDKQTCLCQIWQKRPEICREYECNTDFLLQVALKEDFSNIVELAKKAVDSHIPIESYRYVPDIGEEP